MTCMFKRSFILTLLLAAVVANGEYVPSTHRKPLPGEIVVTAPGVYDVAGKTYVLTSDVSAPASAIFLGADVTLDLNGFTLRYADAKYQHVPNYSFEDGLKGWDVSHAAGAKSVDMRWLHPMDGDHVCVLPKGQEIVSPYITLPVADRAYYAIALVASDKMKVQIRVQDAQGKDLDVKYTLGSETREGVPVTASPRLGGGGVIGLFSGRPARKYRICVKAIDGDAIIDCVDIRPAMDSGVGIVGKIRPYGYGKGLYDGELPSFFDYSTDPMKLSTTPRKEIPVVTGGTVTVKNGVIASGFEGAQSTGLLCSSAGTNLVVENVKFVAAGINTNGLRSDGAVQMHNCRVEIETPFIINRHVHDMPAVIHGSKPSEIDHCEFIGGQGNLAISGDNSLIHHNLFVNAQTVTNHYSVGADANGLKIYNNRFEPRTGSGLYIYRHRDCEVYDNTFTITSAPPSNEYSETDYSTNAIRIGDYNEPAGSAKGCINNKIYLNTITITGMAYPQASKGFMSMSYAVFMSVGGGQNFVWGNEITIDDRHADPATGEAYAFYVGGSDNGGEFRLNKVLSNRPFFWIGNRYGSAKNVKAYENWLTAAEGAGPFPAVKLGWGKYTATEVTFSNNKTVGLPFEVEVCDEKKQSKYELKVK